MLPVHIVLDWHSAREPGERNIGLRAAQLLQRNFGVRPHLAPPNRKRRRRPVLPSQTAALIERDRSAKLGLSVNNMAPQRSHTSLQIGACNSCGACCSYSSDWPRFTMEEEDDLSRIPRDLVDDSLNGMRCHGDRCAALVGEVGVKTGCVIYGQRPDVCRACEPGDAACQIARDRFGLPRMSRGFHVPFRTWARGR